MKTRASKSMALVLLCILLALPAPALATPPEPLKIEAQLWMMGDGAIQGTFSTGGLFVDSGAASEVFVTHADTVHGVKTLVGQHGTITISFQAGITWWSETTSEAVGRFVIASGTGAYERLHGVGETVATLDLGCFGETCPPNIVATYTGRAHFD